MSFLYPRLLSGQAAPLHERYRHLTVTELADLADTGHASAVYVATGGDRVPETKLEELRALVISLAEEAGFPGESDRERRALFDRRLATAVHASMELAPAEAASGDIWAFMALVLLPDVSYWRYPRPPGDRVLGTDLTRHVVGRMWWRAQLIHSPDEPDPYAAMSILGEDAFDRIYSRRRALGGSPYLVKAILKVWDSLDLQGLPYRETLEDFLKRLLRLAPFVLFESLAPTALDGELRAVAKETMTAVLEASETGSHEIRHKIDVAFGS